MNFQHPKQHDFSFNNPLTFPTSNFHHLSHKIYLPIKLQIFLILDIKNTFILGYKFWGITNVHLFLLIYVDDIIVTSNSLFAITYLVSCLKQSFTMKDLGTLHYFLGIHVQPFSGGLHLSKTKYVFKLLDCVQMTGAKLAKTPIPVGFQLS